MIRKFMCIRIKPWLTLGLSSIISFFQILLTVKVHIVNAEVAEEIPREGSWRMNLKMPILLQSVLLLLCFSTTNTRSGNGCRKKCEELWPNSTALQCTAVNCLMRSRGYNKREVPKGDPISNKKDDKDFDIPCCPRKEGAECRILSIWRVRDVHGL